MRPLLAALLLLATAAPLHAEALDPAQRREVVEILREALRTDPTILRDAIAALQADDANRQQQASSAALARLGPALIDPRDPVQGNPDGRVTIVEFYDTRCPYCRSMLPVLSELLHADPDVRLVLKDLPILGPPSLLESRMLLASQSQGGYTRLQQAIMRSAASPTPESLGAMADAAGLDGARLRRDMNDPAIQARLEANGTMAKQLGIEGTPALIIGNRIIAGAADIQELQTAIDRARHP